MPKTLSPAQVERYSRDGFLSPNPALTSAEASACRTKLEAFEAAIGQPLTADTTYRSRTHVLLAWVNDLVRHPRILDAVEDLIGPDILVYTCTWFIKERQSAAIAAWHQDATYFGLRPYVHVTAWVALTDANVENGCMEFLPGSHHGGQRPHQAGVVAASVNRAGQAIVGEVDDAPAVHAPLRAGEFSLHHTLLLHRSAPNTSIDRRIGLGISYIPTSARHLGVKHKTPAMLVRGADLFGHFTLETPPAADMDAAARAAYQRSYDGYRLAYAEQVELER
jgi:ectoine hydroxylase-related dioxygenase (phytanoyl-CoA dioxygenase family)